MGHYRRPDKIHSRTSRRLKLFAYVGGYGLVLAALLGFVLLADTAAQTILQITLQYPGVDKLGHAAMHAGLVYLIYLSLRHLRGGAHSVCCVLAAFTGAALLGVVDELQQTLVPGRSFDYYDVVANLCGGAMAAISIQLYHMRRLWPAFAMVIPLATMGMTLQHDFTTSRYYKAGLMYLSHHDYPHARDMFLQAIQHGESAQGAVYNELAWLEMENMGLDPGDALRYTTIAVAAQPNNADFLDTHGWALYMNRHPRQALDYLLASYRLKNHGYNINYHLGAVYHELGMPDKARQYLRAQLALNDSDQYAQKARELLASPDLAMSE